MAKVPFGGGDDSSPAAAAAGGMPVDPDSDSDKEHPLHEPQFVFHAVDVERRRRQRPALLPVHHRPRPAAADDDDDDDREERLRVFMLMPQAFLCSTTLISGGFMIYLANNPEVRGRPGFDWDVFVTASSALIMLFSLVSLLPSHLGVYYYDGWPGLNQ